MARQDSADAAGGTRDRIKAVAAELYVLRGQEGFSFGDIAAAIGTTRPTSTTISAASSS